MPLYRLLEPIRLMPVWATVIFMIIVIGYVALNVLIPYSSTMIITSLERGSDPWIWVRVLGCVYLRMITQNFINRLFRAWYDRVVLMQLYDQYIAHFFTLSPTAIETYGTGKLMSIVIKGLDTWGMYSVKLLVGPIQTVINSLITAISIRVLVDWRLGILGIMLALAGLGLGYLGTSIVKPLRKYHKTIVDETYRYNALWMMSKHEILQNNKIGHEMKRNRTLFERLIQSAKNIVYHQIYSLELSRLLYVIVVLSSLTWTISQYQGGFITLGTIALLVAYLGRMRADSNDLIQFFEEYNTQMVQIEKMREFFDTTPKIKNMHSSKQFVYQQGNIGLDHVTFGYQADKPVLSDFSLDLKPGQKIALVGPSGGGKTTIMKVIAGFLEPSAGSVQIDGQDIRAVNPLSYYHHIGYLTQDPSVFDGTVRENLLYGITNVQKFQNKQTKNIDQTYKDLKISEDSELSKILQKAQCQFVYDLPKGLDTEIGERGIRLSGGQKQRLAIAKIMLKNPEIILLDEPTSALDSFNEEEVTIALNNLFEGKTVVIIAHRLQTVKHADSILYIEQGQVVESGTHGELIDLHGRYAKMLELQTGF